MASNELYLAVMPLIDLGSASFGQTREFLTLFPDKSFATEFFAEEADRYISTFQNRVHLLTGGHVLGYDIKKEITPEGRVIVQVIQNVG